MREPTWKRSVDGYRRHYWRLSTGALGDLVVCHETDGTWWWEWTASGVADSDFKSYKSAEAARKAAAEWMRRAVRRAARKLRMRCSRFGGERR